MINGQQQSTNIIIHIHLQIILITKAVLVTVQLLRYSRYHIYINLYQYYLRSNKSKSMARANGYIIAKELQKEGDNFEVSMDISAGNRTLAFGYGPMIKLVSINTDVNFWFQDRKVVGKTPIFDKDQMQKINIPNTLRVVRDIRWNWSDLGKNLIGVAMGQSAFVYDVQDMQNIKTPEGYFKVFQSDDVMRQGDYPTKFIWYPNSKDLFLCTSSKSDQIVIRDLREQSIVIKFNGVTSDSKSEQKIEDLKFRQSDQDAHIFATIYKNSTIEIFDVRKPNQSICRQESVIQNYKSNLLEWEWSGNRLASCFGWCVKIWEFNGSELVQKQSFQHKNAISDLKWLRKHPQYLLVSELQENIVFGYKISKEKHDIQILVDPRHSGIKKFMTDRNQELLLGLTNFEDSKKYNHEMIAVFIDFKSSQQIWSKTKFTKPNSFGLDNELLFCAGRRSYQRPSQSYALIYKQVQSSARRIEKQLTNNQRIVAQAELKIHLEQRNKLKDKMNTVKQELRELKKQKKKRPSIQFLPENDEVLMQEQQKTRSKLKKSTSIDNKSMKQKGKNHRSVQKKEKNSISEEIYSDSSEEPDVIQDRSKWLLSYEEEVQYLDKNYRIEINDQITELKGENICKYNSKVAKSIAKHRCAEFWKYIYNFAFPDNEEKYTLSGLYEDKAKIDVIFKENKIIASCQSKSQMYKKTVKYNIQKLIQNLVDENELQTAVMACIMIRNKDPKLITLQFIEPFLVCYKEMLKAMGLTFISTNLSFIARLNQAIPSPMFSFEIPIGCGQCFRKFNDSKCTCVQVCIICGEPLRSSLVIGCKICGHMAHAREYQKRIINEGNKKCPYDECKHQCFKV